MYMLAYRNLGIFQENAVNCILRDVVRAAQPISATVTGEFSPEGGFTQELLQPGAGNVGAVSDDREINNEELAETIRRIREQVRAQHPTGNVPPAGITLADLMPLLHARDAAEGKVASIGIVNPRAGGLVNNVIQSLKRLVSRVLDWHVREQVEFNRAAVQCVNATLEALNETNRGIAKLAALNGSGDSYYQLLDDMRTHWDQWRQGWESKLATSEVQLLRSVAELQGAFQHRVGELERSFQARVADVERSFREMVRIQHQEFKVGGERAMVDAEKRLREDFDRVRNEYERLIHNELRVVRQRASAYNPVPPATPAAPAPAEQPQFDYLRFSERFRGSEEHVKKNQEFYVEKFRGREAVLDLGCGRGEFLEAAAAAGIRARGIELSAELVAISKANGLQVEEADMFPYLESLDTGSLDGIFCAQVVEHLPPARLPQLIALAADKLRRDGLLVIETPNPECLAIFASHFYIDPTHTHPVPASLLVFYLEEFGFGRIEVEQRSPAVESMPSLAELPDEFRKAFFGGLDYAVSARRL